MAKEKDCSTKLSDLVMEREFKLFIGQLDQEIAGMAARGDRYFDIYEAGKIILINSSLSEEERRIALATVLKKYDASYAKNEEEFYLEIKTADLSPEKVLDVLIDGELFDKRSKKLQGLDQNERVMQLSKEFYMKPSLIAKYSRTRK